MLDKLRKYGASVAAAGTGLALAAQPVFAQLADVEVEVGTGFATDFGSLLSALLTFVMVIAALLVFLYLIWGGIEWITSGGDKGKTQAARSKIIAAVVGLIIVASSYAILLLALNFLGFESLNDVFEQTKTLSGN